MKKSITSLALAVSALSATSALAMMPMPSPGQPLPPPIQYKTVCLANYGIEKDGMLHAGDCDETTRNQAYGRELNESGCAVGQIVIKTTTLEIPACSTVMQL